MKTTVTENDFIEAFRCHDRVSNFGDVTGVRSLFAYLEQIEDATGEELELDVIELCYDFTYYEGLSEYNTYYGTNYRDVYAIDDLACIIDADDGPFITYAH